MGQESRHYVEFPARHPEGGSDWSVRISNLRIEQVGRRTKGQVMELAYLVPQVLSAPAAIFEGIRWDEDEARDGMGWLCYCGVPTCAYNPDGSQRQTWPDKLYLVFVNRDRVAYNNRWEKCDPGDPRLPIDHGNRFVKKLL